MSDITALTPGIWTVDPSQSGVGLVALEAGGVLTGDPVTIHPDIEDVTA